MTVFIRICFSQVSVCLFLLLLYSAVSKILDLSRFVDFFLLAFFVFALVQRRQNRPPNGSYLNRAPDAPAASGTVLLSLNPWTGSLAYCNCAKSPESEPLTRSDLFVAPRNDFVSKHHTSDTCAEFFDKGIYSGTEAICKFTD